MVTGVQKEKINFNFMMPDNLIEKYCVRIKCNGNTGSGVIISNKETFYVFTAAHCLGETTPDIKNIKIEKQNDYISDFKNISVIRLIEHNINVDFALIEIYLERETLIQSDYKLGRAILSGSLVKFCGYQGINSEQYRPFDGCVLTNSEDKGRFKITLQDITFDQAGDDGHYVAKGLSGSGVFIYRHNSPFLIGILNSVITDKAWNDDIECCSVKHLEKHIPDYVDLSDFENLKKWNENIENKRTKIEIEAFKGENSDFFDKLYRKNQVLYPEIEKANKVSAKQIRKFLAMKDNVRTLENDYPHLYLKFKGIVKQFVDQVEDDYSQSVDKSNEAVNLKRELQDQLKSEFDIMPKSININLSEYQIIEWLGICTLNFTKND